MSSGSLLNGYDVVACQDCGFCFADSIPEQMIFDHYYTEMSKYEYSDHDGIQSDTDLQRFREAADLISPHLDTNVSLLDIGCATGGLLAEFKRRGFADLFGVDPSPACAETTQRLYGIPARPLSISTLDQLGDRFDVIVLTGVLEHLRDVDFALNMMKTCLRSGGYIYYEVPDATRYDQHFSAPFQFFSMEHVNFFSPKSLTNLLARFSFSCIFTERVTRHLSPIAIEPGIGSLFRWDSPNLAETPFMRDDETEAALRRYIIHGDRNKCA